MTRRSTLNAHRPAALAARFRFMHFARAACVAGVCAAALSACVVEPARPPQPEPLVEVVPAAPAPGYRWVKGHYRWEGNHWQWIRGHWAPV